MTSEMTTSWALLLGLGVFHGINPGMGWLFAVALGMQERSRAAIYKALLPLMGGHALAIAIAVALAMLAGTVVPLRAIQWTVGGVLLALGLSRFFKHAHPRWVRMQVGLRDLTIWSFLMASAHGAGLMVLPVVMGGAAAPHHHLMHGAPGGVWLALWATLLHSAGYLMTTAAVALVVFEKLGLGLLRRTWLNLDVVWTAALMATGIATLTIG